MHHTFPDEMVFIGYHQINELIFKLILWELQQVAVAEVLEVDFYQQTYASESLFDMLTSSQYNPRRYDVEQYNKFRHTLTPASGFQSAQYRKIEFASTELINLIDARFRKTIDRNNTPFEHALEHLYWQAAGKDYKTEKSILLTNFENRYKEEFITFMKVYNTKNLGHDIKNYHMRIKAIKNLLLQCVTTIIRSI